MPKGKKATTNSVNIEMAFTAFKSMCLSRAMAAIYDENRPITKYVHSTSKGHEAIQLATAYHLQPQRLGFTVLQR